MTARSRIDALYRKHGHAVYRRALRLLGHDADARDVVQDVFLDLFRTDRFAGRSSMATYLYSMATHACLNRLRNGRTRSRLVAIEVAGRTTGEATTEARALAHEILAQLDEDSAALAVYLYCDELTHQEIAELLGCSRRHVGDLERRLRHLAERVA